MILKLTLIEVADEIERSSSDMLENISADEPIGEFK